MKTNTKTKSHILHSPVLLSQTLVVLDPKSGESYLDLTGGYGGHAHEVLMRTGREDLGVLSDRDPMAIQRLKDRFPSAAIAPGTFIEVCEALVRQGKRFDMILADLGTSSPHLDNAERGFSLQRSGPLDMRMNQSEQTKTAADIVNTASREELETILRVYGEERFAGRIVSEILHSRPFETTLDLSDCVRRAVPGHLPRHPATKTFQALRIAVNDELTQIQVMLPLALQLLTSGGRFAVISFHSLEDRLVKHFFTDQTSGGYEASFDSLTKRPLTATQEEISFNPRARSAKLRAVVKK
jgi:16S rRNA (cytosine1402-N4)-methyltransferase